MTISEANRHVSKSAKEVQDYTLQTLDLITQWISSGETDPDQPACKWENSAHLRRGRSSQKQSDPGSSSIVPGEVTLDDQQIVDTVLYQTLQDGVNPWTHRFLDKLYTTPTTLSPAIELLLGAMNASGVVSSASPSLSLAEEYTVEGFANLLGWDPKQIDGLTMPGGSSSNVLAVQTALGNRFASFKQDGIPGVIQDLLALGRQGRNARPVLITSEQSHYSLEKAALACGMGLSSIVKIKCNQYGAMRLDHLEEVLTKTYRSEDSLGFPFFINATAGTTILGAFDNLEGITNTVKKVFQSLPNPPQQFPWIHCDASWGGPVLFSSKSRYLMKGVENIDSLTINPHKLLNITQQCSFGLFRKGESLAVNVTGAKYLFHSATSTSEDQDGISPTLKTLRLNPGSKTMGCGRKPDAFKFYIEWLRVGTKGFGLHVDKSISYAVEIIQLIQKHAKNLKVAQATPTSAEARLYCQVCFRPSIPSEDLSWVNGILTSEEVDYLLSSSTHHLHSELRKIGQYAIDKAPLAYPHPQVGYFTRLVTHPNTSLEIYKDIVIEMDQLALQWWQMVKSQGQEGIKERVRAERLRD
ncbi:unnamed protein product [Sympodiomycopsis kandeliae]